MFLYIYLCMRVYIYVCVCVLINSLKSQLCCCEIISVHSRWCRVSVKLNIAPSVCVLPCAPDLQLPLKAKVTLQHATSSASFLPNLIPGSAVRLSLLARADPGDSHRAFSG